MTKFIKHINISKVRFSFVSSRILMISSFLLFSVFVKAQTYTAQNKKNTANIESTKDCGGSVYRIKFKQTNAWDDAEIWIKENGTSIGANPGSWNYADNVSMVGWSGYPMKVTSNHPNRWVYAKIDASASTKRIDFFFSDFSCDGFLPVELVDFNVKPEGCFAHLTWSTASEINNDYFIVEYSYDGTDWKEIDNAKVSGAGNSSEVIDYCFYDFDCSHNRLVYYRIVQVDFDGTRTNSVVKSLNLGKPKLVKVYPNPTKGYITIDVNLELGDKTGNLVVKTIAGQKVFSKAIVNGKNEFDLSKFSPDTYIIKVSSENQLPYYEKLIIIK